MYLHFYLTNCISYLGMGGADEADRGEERAVEKPSFYKVGRNQAGPGGHE